MSMLCSALLLRDESPAIHKTQIGMKKLFRWIKETKKLMTLRLIHEKEIKDLERIELRESLDIHGSFEWPVAFPATGNAWVSRASPKFSKDNGKVIPDNTIAENFNKDRKVSLKNE